MEALSTAVEQEGRIIIIMSSAWDATSAQVVVSQMVVTDLLSVQIVGPVRYHPVVEEFLKQGEQPQEAVAVVVAEGFQRMGAVMTVAAMEVQVMKEAADSKTSTEAQVVLIVVVMMTTKGEDQVETRGAETTAMKENSRSVLNTRCQG